MSQEFIEFPKSIKSCSVVLERLDDKILSQYAQKYNIKMVDVVQHSTIYSNNFSGKSEGNRREIKKSTKMNKIKKRRRKIRVLSSSDDESSNETKQRQNFVTEGKDNSGNTKRSLHDRDLLVSNGKNVDDEIEIIQEIKKPCALLKDGVKQNLTIGKADFEGDESDFREDNEDDKITVIFEESPNKNTMDEREIKSSVGKHENKTPAVENAELGEKLAEKSAPNELIGEDHLKRLCNLVKRLHELFRIISQLQPHNVDPGVHFSKVIKAQKISFFKEIKICQKPVIECYKKLLTFYGNSSKIISKISQHTFLSLEDVSNIISRCLLLGKFQPQKNNEIQPKNLRRVSDNLKKLLAGKRVSKDSQTAPHLYSFPRSESVSYQYEIIPTNDESILPFSPGKDVVSHSSFLPSHSDYNMQKQNICAQQKSQNQAFESLQNDFRYASAVPDSLRRSIQYSYPQSVPSNFLVSSPVSQKRPEVSAPVIPTHPFHVQQFYIPNCYQQKSALDEPLSNFSSSVQNISKCAALRQRNNPHAFPLSIHRDVQNLARHPLGDFINDSGRLSKQNSYELFASGEEILGKQCFNEYSSRIEVRNNPNEGGQEFLNFRVPGYLPVKNYQIQGTAAGRGIEENEGDSSPFSESEDCSRLRKEDSNFRIYVCAQINCKMPGIRICKGCQSVIYCSEICQLKHWALKHKMECYQLRELRIS